MLVYTVYYQYLKAQDKYKSKKEFNDYAKALSFATSKKRSVIWVKGKIRNEMVCSTSNGYVYSNRTKTGGDY